MKYLLFASLLSVGAFASTCHPKYECCKGCKVYEINNEGKWGYENGNWCVIDKSLCENYADNGYPYCTDCAVYLSDEEGDWGVNDNKWCIIRKDNCKNHIVSGYPYCDDCNVVFTDESGDWGVANNEWCAIQKDKCPPSSNSSEDTPSSTDTPSSPETKNVIPVLTLISSSGTSDFASKPISKHISRQSGKNRDAPEPYYEDCVISLEDTDGTKLIDGVNGKVKVRGNWTTNYAKKPLRINFEESINLLGLHGGEKYNSWVLFAEYKDGSMLRNKSAFKFSRDILGEDNLYASDTTLVELRINDEYYGVYVIGELQEIAKGRVSITKPENNYQGTDIGYLVELDFGYSYAEEDLYKFTLNYNDNAPLKPYDGLGGSGKTITPIATFGNWNWGNMGFGNFTMPGFGNNNNGTQTWPGFGNNNGNFTIPGFGNNNGTQTWPGFGNNNNNTQTWPGFGNNNRNNGGNRGNMNFGGNVSTENSNADNTSTETTLRKRQFGSSENMTIKSSIYSQEQHDFIANFLNGVYKILYEASYNKNTLKFNDDYSEIVEAPDMTPREAIEAVLDVNSLADMFIISEMTCDADLYYSSFYMDVDFGANGSKKLRFEAPWDFDSSLGNRSRCVDGQGHFAANIIPDNNNMGEKINPWLAVIMYEDWYQDIIRSKWTKAYDGGVFDRVIEDIYADTENAKEAFDRNYEKWNNIVLNSQFKNELSARALKCKTQSEAAQYLAEWIGERVEFINNHWHE